MPSLEPEQVPLVLEALEELMYKVSLELEGLKGGPLTRARRELTAKQRALEELQHAILTQVAKPK